MQPTLTSPRWRRPALALALVAIGRILMWWRWAVSDRLPSDVAYYFTKTQELPTAGIDQTLIEYPVPVVWLLGLPQLLAPGDQELYLTVFVVIMVLADLWFCWLLWSRTERPLLAIGVWSAFLFSMGTIVYLRFDMIPAVLVGAALLLVKDRPGVSGALVAIGAAIKLWPAAVLLPLLAIRPRSRQLGGFLLAGGGLAVLSLLLTGWERTASALTWQSDRGLQIESVWASPLLVARLHGGDAEVIMSHYNAFEVSGTGVEQWMAWSTIATLAGGLAIAAITIRGLAQLRAPEAGTERPAAQLQWLAVAVTAMIAVVIVTNKTLSPQYLLWLGAPLVVAVAADPNRLRRWLWAAGLLVLGTLTQLVYPVWYDALWGGTGVAADTARVTWTLAIRNVLLVGAMVLLLWQAWFHPTFRADGVAERAERGRLEPERR